MQKDVSFVLKGIKKMLGPTTPVVRHSTPFKVLISTVLSARTRDENTAKASKQLFKKFPTAKKLSQARVSEIEKLIKPAGFYRVKARRVKGIAKQILKEFNGMVPQKLEGLLELKGVGRKTANCVLVYAYRKPAIPVDVHVHRISNRIGLVKTKTPEETEAALKEVFPRKKWIELNELMVKLGQRVCRPLAPNCRECMIQGECNYFKSIVLPIYGESK